MQLEKKKFLHLIIDVGKISTKSIAEIKRCMKYTAFRDIDSQVQHQQFRNQSKLFYKRIIRYKF
jgi:hypothetical protein